MEHSFRVHAICENKVSEWSDVVKGITQKESFEASGWKECPDYVNIKMKYSIDEKSPRTATKTNNCWCTIIGNTPLPQNNKTLWSIKVLKSRNNNGNDILIGVSPSDIKQNESRNFKKCGWYLNCFDSALRSGPPHNYRYKEYGPRKENGKYVHTGDNVGVVMDTTKGELSFVVNGMNLGVAFDGIPLDKPLVPCVLICDEGDSVALITSEEDEVRINSENETQERKKKELSDSTNGLAASPEKTAKETGCIPCEDWVTYITGLSEPDLRNGETIKGIIHAEAVPGYKTHKFTFVNSETKAEYSAGYFYTESVGAMEAEFRQHIEGRNGFKSCKFVVDVRADYVKGVTLSLSLIGMFLSCCHIHHYFIAILIYIYVC